MGIMHRILEACSKADPRRRKQLAAAAPAALGFFILVGEELLDGNFRKAFVKILIALAFIIVVVAIGWISMKAGKLVGKNAAAGFGAALMLAAMGAVIWYILSHWGK